MAFSQQQQCESYPLHDAAKSGDMEKVREILECGKCNVNCTNSSGWTPLHWACCRGHLEVVRVLVSEFKSGTTIKTPHGYTPLMLAADNNHDNVVHALLSDSQCPIDSKNQSGYTALHFSCVHGYVNIMRTLVKHKANVNARTHSGDTSLTLAAIYGHNNVVHILLSDSQCPVDDRGHQGYTALHYSCRYDHVNIVKTLVKHKANVNAENESGDTPLALAARYGHNNVMHALCIHAAEAKNDCNPLLHSSCAQGSIVSVRALLNEHKADVNSRTDSGDTPLTLAARHGHDNVVHALLSDFQCPVDARGQNGYTALHYSCRYGHVDIVRTLIKHKANFNDRTDSGDTPLTLAARNKHDNIVHALSDYNCEIFARAKYAYTALLHSSCERGYLHIVKTLLNEHKANINLDARTDSGDTPLTLAARNKHDNVVHALSNYNCEVYAKDKDAYTALLHSSCERGYLHIVKTLLNEHKDDINLNARTDSGDTPLTLAARNKHDNVVHALSNYNCEVYAKDKDAYTALLHSSCERGYLHIVKTLLNEHKDDINLNARTDSGDTPLTLAARNKHDNVVHALSNYNCEVYAKDKDAYTALLHLSCERGYVDIVRAILKTNRNYINAKGQDGYTALHYSCRYGHLDIVRTLVMNNYSHKNFWFRLYSKADVNARTDSGDTPLTLAAINKHDNVVHALSDYNCEVYAKDKDAYTALLHLSCERGYVDIVRTVLKRHKADVNARTDSGDTPLTLAAKNRHYDIVHVLSDYNCELQCHTNDKDEYTALLLLSCKRGYVQIVRKTIETNSADINARTESFDTPLIIAARYGHNKVVHALLSDSQCLFDVKGQDGYTAFHFSCRYGHADIVRTLVKHEANVNARTDSCDTPLTLAARYGHNNVVHALLSDSQCLFDVKGKDGYTALHFSCRYGHADIVRTLVKHEANVNARTDSCDTPLTLAARFVHDNVVHALSDYNCEVYAKDKDAYTALLHSSCERGYLRIVKTLLNEHKDNINLNAIADSGHTPLTLAAINKHDDVVYVLSDYNCEVYAKGKDAYTVLLHLSCERGYVYIVRTILKTYMADVNARTDSGDTSLTLAAIHGHDNVVHALLSDSRFLVDSKDKNGFNALHYSCRFGHVDIVKILVKNKANLNARTDSGDTPLTLSAINKHDDLVHALSDYNCEVYAKDKDAYTALLHLSCKRGYVRIVRTILKTNSVDINARTNIGDTPLSLAAKHGDNNVVLVLLSDSQCLVDTKGQDGYTALHYSCRYGHVYIVKILVMKKANFNARTDSGDTPLTLAAINKHDNVVHALSKYNCEVYAKDKDAYTALLHSSCERGYRRIVKTLLNERRSNINLNARTDSGDTPLTLAAINKHDDLVHALSDYNCEVYAKDKETCTALLHLSCRRGYVYIVKTLFKTHKVDVNVRTDSGDTPLTLAARHKHDNIVHVLSEYNCEVQYHAKDKNDYIALLHLSCKRGYVRIVRTLLKANSSDINFKTKSGDTPLHVAVQYGQLQVAIALIKEFNCDIYAKGHMGRSLLHSACASSRSNVAVLEYVCEYLSPLLVDEDGNTPLHIACLNNRNIGVFETLLKYNPPMLVRNKDGKTPLNVVPHRAKNHALDQFMEENKEKIYHDYRKIQKFAKKKYSSAKPITRIFVIGNPGAGKSSLVETLKREGFFESLRRVSVPLHTAGIVPSIHTSKHYGRSLFYDFAGDPQYYSSHAAILENLVSSKKGDNIFIIVVDLREENIKIRESLYYWLLFIHHQNLGQKEPLLIIVGSHSDQMARDDVEDKRIEMQKFCDEIQPEVESCHRTSGVLHKVAHIILDCRNTWDQHLGDIQKLIASFIKDSPCHILSLYASTLLGLLEKDFSNEPAFTVAELQFHIEVTHIALPRETQSLHSVLLELHDIGLLFIVNDSNKEHFHIVFNISKLTNEVHRLLFSTEAKLSLRKSCVEIEGSNSSFNIGIIPKNFLEEILPENIPKEFLVQLQYCQLINHKDVGTFPSLTPSDSTDQSFLFFPALCSVDKSEVSWVTPPDLSYSIGWLAQCTDPCDYFPPRFLHVLLLRLVFRFTLSVPAQNQASGASPDLSHFQRLCTMWKTGVHWLMEEGVECMVELVSANKRVVVITKSEEDTAENCISVFNQIISCVMEAKAEFCYSIKPQFYLVNCTCEEVDNISEDHLFPMREVEKALTHSDSEGNKWILSIGTAKIDRSKLLSLRILTHWHILFPIDFLSVHHLLENVVDKVYELGLELKVPNHTLDELETNFPTDVVKRRREVVKGWMSSTHHPPCWWHLVQALKRIGMNALAEEIQREHSKSHVLLEP